MKPLTDKQRQDAIDLVKKDKFVGNVEAIRKAAGIRGGTKREIRALIDDELEAALLDARGWSLERMKNVDFEVGLDKDHPHAERVRYRWLKAYDPAFRDQASVEVEHSGEVKFVIESAFPGEASTDDGHEGAAAVPGEPEAG